MLLMFSTQPYEWLFVLECQINAYRLQINKPPKQGNKSLHLLFLFDIDCYQSMAKEQVQLLQNSYTFDIDKR